MGCTVGRKRFVVNNDVEGQDSQALEIITMLGLSSDDIDMLYTAFWDIDADSSGLIRPEELFAYFEIEGTPFERKIFALFDEDSSGVINFLEFVCTLWNILTLPPTDSGAIAYLLKDPTGKESISHNDARILLEMLHNRKHSKDLTLGRILDQMKQDLDTRINIYNFTQWSAANPSTIAPLTMLQLHLRSQIIGESFWIKLSEHRKNHPEQGRLDYCQLLRETVVQRNGQFRERVPTNRVSLRREAMKRTSKVNNSSPTKKKRRTKPSSSSKEEGFSENANEYGVSSPPNRSRCTSLDQEEAPEDLLKSPGRFHSHKKVLPVMIKYDSPSELYSSPSTVITTPPALSLAEKSPSRSKGEPKEVPISTLIERKISEKNHQARKKKKAEYKKLVSRAKPRKFSVFDVFDDASKWNFDALNEENEEDHLHVSEKASVPMRRRRSTITRPNLLIKK